MVKVVYDVDCDSECMMLLHTLFCYIDIIRNVLTKIIVFLKVIIKKIICRDITNV